MSRPPTPPPDGIDINAIVNPIDDSIEAMSSPTALFSIDRFNNHTPPPVRPDIRAKRKSNQLIAPASPRSPSKRPATSATRSSPCRSAFRALVRAAASCRDGTNQVPRRVSPPSVLQSVFDDPLPPPPIVRRSKSPNKDTKKGRSRTMLGLIPKTEFLHEFHPSFSNKTNLTSAQINKDLKDKRKWMNAHFHLWDNQWQKQNDDVVGPRLRSSNKEIEDWIIDSVKKGPAPGKTFDEWEAGVLQEAERRAAEEDQITKLFISRERRK